LIRIGTDSMYVDNHSSKSVLMLPVRQTNLYCSAPPWIWPKHVGNLRCEYYTIIHLCAFVGFDNKCNCWMLGCGSF